MRYLMLLALLLPAISSAQTQTVAATAKLSWVLPTQTVDGKPLSPGSLTKIQVWARQSSIPVAPTAAPTIELPGTATTYTYTGTVPNGTTLYFRVAACTQSACSALSEQVSKGVMIEVPGVPAGVSVTVTVVLSGS